MNIKKNFFAPLASGLGAMRRAAMLLLVMMLTTATAWAQGPWQPGQETSGSCGYNLTWELTGESPNYTLTITGTGAMADYASSSDQPWKDYRSSIKTVVIGAGVTSIGNYTFAYCTGLTSIEIPASVTSIGGSAFWNCSYLATVTFAEDSQLTSIGNNAFNNTGLTSINIPASVTTIGNNAFRNCSGLATVTFAAGSQLTSIGNIAFNYTGLTSINIPASVTSIGNGAFINCSNLEAMTVDGENAVYDSRDNCNAIIEKSSNTLIAGCKNTTIPDDVTIIRDYAFNGCTGLTSIEIPASVTSIGGYAFYGCTGLTSIEIPAGVTSIGVSAFEGCSGLTSIEIPAGVTSIGGSTFYGCTGLTSIEIPASVTTIGNSAFQNCSNLATVTVYAPSCTLGDFAFSGCDKLANIYVFSDLVDTYQIKKNWKTYAGKIKGITGGYCGTTDHETDVVWVLTGESPNYTLTITGTGAMADYVPSDQPWKDYRSSIKTFVIGNGVTTIGNLAFGRCTGLTSINIPSSVTSIGCYAFYNTNLTSIEIPASVTSIDYEAFSGCTGLTSVTFATGSQLTSIGDATFQSCSSLTSIEIPASVENIGDQAFDNCSSLTSIIIPASVTSIGDHAFDNCSNLATITVYAPDCTLGGSAFSGCNKLTNIYVLSNKVVSYKSAWSAYADKIAVIFDGTSTTTVNFDNDVTVNGVLYNRTFTASKPSTVMLPFSLGEGQMLTGGTLYKFTGVTKNETTGKWEATMTETATLQTNTPYLLLPDENLTDGKVTFNLNNGTVTLNTNGGGNRVTADPGSHWKFKGTYEYMKWTTDTNDPDYNADRKAEIGRAYGFAGVAKDDINVGDFVKVASGAKIRPMGCYLLWNDTPNASRAAARSAATEELPQSITVRLVSADGEVTGIGEIDTKTGEMTFDSEAWYTLNGVRLSGKPTKKGLYIYNGRKVVVK
ncbi:leucine-rich repeat domain-containing protein [Prevotella sp. tf2-5]|uniref:leucine-rich repeat domain-containing protein n=1 Tax=Prevotella sp. tf2-5 TaxID=1761889 RepID=UPI0015A6A38B|nr:leucine-rich repeat domain-containing protein [Prevotella sp. tf2-5]